MVAGGREHFLRDEPGGIRPGQRVGGGGHGAQPVRVGEQFVDLLSLIHI